MDRPGGPHESDTSTVERTYNNLIRLWTSGVRDYHSLLSDYLTANSIFVAAIGFLLARDLTSMIFIILVIILCTFGVLMAFQMAIVLGRFSAQNTIWEWRLRGIERTGNWNQRGLFVDLHRFRDQQESLQDPENDPPALHPSWAVRRHRQWWARREISFPLFFGIIYALFLLWASLQLLKTPS